MFNGLLKFEFMIQCHYPVIISIGYKHKPLGATVSCRGEENIPLPVPSLHTLAINWKPKWSMECNLNLRHPYLISINSYSYRILKLTQRINDSPVTENTLILLPENRILSTIHR